MIGSASLPFTCDECGARFLPADGAACRRCRRVLCARHFALPERGVLRSLFRRRTEPDAGPLCRACARQATPDPGAS